MWTPETGEAEINWETGLDIYTPLIAYSEGSQIRDLQRRKFSFGTRDQAGSLKSFCAAKFYCSVKRDRESV